MKRLLNKMYHISETEIKGIIFPRVPYNFLTKRGYENTSIARICFAPTVAQCLLALGGNLEGKEFYVYEPDDYSKLNIIDNETINKNKYVFDSHETGEIWVTNSIQMKLVGKIKVNKAIDEPICSYHNGMKVESYWWNYDVMEGELK